MSKDEAIEATGSLHVVQAKPNYNVTFHKDWKMVGKLDFNGDVMTFEGDADESAKVFMDFIAMRFEQRLKEERAKARKWVGLTDEDIAEGAKQSWVDKQAFESAVWWAEGKLKEKNHGNAEG